MIKQKVTITAKCDDCGATQKEQEFGGSGVGGIIGKLESQGWYVPIDYTQPCYCPTCHEIHRRKNERHI